MKESFKHIFDNYEPKPPPAAWNTIASNLDAHKKGLILTRAKKAGIITGTTLLVSGIFIYGFIVGNKQLIEETPQVITENTSSIAPEVKANNTEVVSIQEVGSNSKFASIKKIFTKEKSPVSETPLLATPLMEEEKPPENKKQNTKIEDILYAEAKGQQSSEKAGFDRSKYVSPLDDDFLKYYYFDNPNVKMPTKAKEAKDAKESGEKQIGSNYEEKEFKTKVVISDLISQGFALERGIYFGGGLGAHYSSISGGKNMPTDFFKTNFTDKLFSMGTSVELVIGYDFNKNFGIVAEVKYAQINQKYSTPYYELGVVKEENIQLSYIRAPILLKYRMLKLMKHNHKPIAINYLLGPHMSYLVNVNRTIDGEKGNFHHLHNQREVGLTAAIEADLFFTPKFFMTVGYRAEVGWGTQNLDLEGKIRTFNTGIYARFNLRQPQTIKKTTSYYK